MQRQKKKKRTFLVFVFELDEVVDEMMIKIISTKVWVSPAVAFTLEIFLSIVKRYTERSSKIEDENIMLTRNLFVQTVGDCSSHGLVEVW